MEPHFCTCTVTRCPRHPSQHGEGCDPCIRSNLKQGKIPSCFFRIVRDDIGGVTDFSIKGFVEFYNRCQDSAGE